MLLVMFAQSVNFEILSITQATDQKSANQSFSNYC